MRLIIKKAEVKEIFMAALLSCTEQYKDAEVTLLSKDEDPSHVNVTSEVIKSLCPNWVQSELICSMISNKVCAPVLESPDLNVNEKVKKVREVLIKYAKAEGLPLPA